MFVLFDEAGKFMAGRVLSESDASVQVELDSGKRLKVKATHVLLRFEKPAPSQFVAAALALSESIELEMAWEFSPEEDFGFSELARDYFSAQASLEQQAAMLFRLFEAPHYFRRAGKGRFRKASAEIIAQALVALEKKKHVAAQIAQWAQALASGSCPEPVAQQMYKILFKPDKNAAEYKAVVEASRATHTGPLELLQRCGAIHSPYQFHWKRFLLENFPKGLEFGNVTAPAVAEALPLAGVQAFSIDDSATTEIDDALSVQGLGSGTVTVGVHIAAPGKRPAGKRSKSAKPGAGGGDDEYEWEPQRSWAFLQAGDKMQRALKQKTGRKRIEAQLRLPRGPFQPQRLELGLPPGPGPVIVRQHDAMAGVAHPIHESQGGLGQPTILAMVFEHQTLAGHPHRLPQEHPWILRVVQHIHKHHGIKAGVGMRDAPAIKGSDGNVRLGADQNIDALNANVRTFLLDKLGDQAIAAADIQHLGLGGQDPGQLLAQYAHPPFEDVPAVNGIQ